LAIDDWSSIVNSQSAMDSELHEPAPTLTRTTALLEVLLCSGLPTQIAVIGFLQALGIVSQDSQGRLSIVFVMALSLADTVLVVGLVLLFLRAQREQVRDVLARRSPARGEVALGLLLIPAAIVIALVVVKTIWTVAPWLRNMPRNPFEDLLTSDVNRLLFGIVVIVAGGLREEIQRAFILHRFEQRLGGAVLGLVLFSLAFGLFHLSQGHDVAIATGTLGAFWGATYLWRRSIVAPAISHAGFNVLEIVNHTFAPS
jgi:membrane protease YdiL (CAAX protease family)